MKAFLLSFVLIIFTISAAGQRLKTPTLSPNTKIAQELGLTEISLDYSRPSAKGRVIMGDLVPYDKIWRTGANASTKLALTESAKIGGKSIEAGTYAIYTIPGETEWVVIVHSDITMRSIAGDRYKAEKDVFRFKVPSLKTENYVETFTIQFADITSKSCNLRLSWEHTSINILIEVEVDQKIATQMEEYLQTPEKLPHRTYFEAAQYYLHNDKDLDTALSWIDSALAKSDNNFRYGLLKAKIQFKQGNRKAAMMTINEAHEWAKTANNANYMEQTSIFRESMMKG